MVRPAGPGFPEHRYDTHTPEELTAITLGHPPYPDPRKTPSCSNTDFVIAGMVAEKATGRSYDQEVTRRVIRPSELRETSFPGTAPQMPEPHPSGYSRLHRDAPGAEVHDATEQDMTWLGAAGGVISTPGVLTRRQRPVSTGRPPSGTGFRFDLGAAAAVDGRGASRVAPGPARGRVGTGGAGTRRVAGCQGRGGRAVGAAGSRGRPDRPPRPDTGPALRTVGGPRTGRVGDRSPRVVPPARSLRQRPGCGNSIGVTDQLPCR